MIAITSFYMQGFELMGRVVIQIGGDAMFVNNGMIYLNIQEKPQEVVGIIHDARMNGKKNMIKRKGGN